MLIQVDSQHKAINVLVDGENYNVEFDEEGRAEVPDAVGETLQRLSGARVVTSEKKKPVDLEKLEAKVAAAQEKLNEAKTALDATPDDAKAQKAHEKAQKALDDAQSALDAAKADGAGE